MNQVTRIGTDLRALVTDEAMLDLALEGTDIAPLLMVLVHLSGESHWLDEVGPHINGPWNFQESVPAELKYRLRTRMKAILRDFALSGRPLPSAATARIVAENAVLGRGWSGAGRIYRDDIGGNEPSG